MTALPSGLAPPAKGKGAWVCPGCGAALKTPQGLSWHLVAIGPGYDQWACKAAREFYLRPKEQKQSVGTVARPQRRFVKFEEAAA